MNGGGGVTRNLYTKFDLFRAEAKPKVDHFAYGITKDFYDKFAVLKAKLEVGGPASAALSPNPRDELQRVPDKCMDCGSWFGIFSWPRLCPCCKRVVLCSSCITKTPSKVFTANNGAVSVNVCGRCATAMNTLIERSVLKKQREGEVGQDDPLLSVWLDILITMDVGNKRLKRLSSITESMKWSNSPEIKEGTELISAIEGIQDKLKIGEKGLSKFEFTEGTSHFRMKQTFIRTIKDWDELARAAIWHTKIRMDEAAKRGPANTVDLYGPIIDSVEPMLAPLRGMTPLRVRGSGFDKRAEVLLSGRPCRIVSRKTSPGKKDEIVALSIPCRTECTVPITVRNPDGTSFTLDGVTYISDDALTEEDMNILMGINTTSPASSLSPSAGTSPQPQKQRELPSIATISPVTIPLRGGKVSIIGSGFARSGVRVYAGKMPTEMVSVSENGREITVVVPPSAEDARVTITVVNPNGDRTACEDILFYTKLIDESEKRDLKVARKEEPPKPQSRRRVWGK